MKYKVNFRNQLLLILCVLTSLFIGNIALLMFPDLAIIYRILISIIVTIIYVFSFYRLIRQKEKFKKWQYAFVSIFLSLIAMLVACIFISIGMRLSIDNILIAGFKGIVPTFIFAIFFASPFWISLSIVNFICISNLTTLIRVQISIKLNKHFRVSLEVNYF